MLCNLWSRQESLSSTSLCQDPANLCALQLCLTAYQSLAPMCSPGEQDEDRRSEGVEIASFWLWDLDGTAV